MPVQIIQPTRPAAHEAIHRRSVLRVTAYCRVSTDSDEQQTSYESQRRHYTTFITSHPGWLLAGIFADEGISGTQAKRRPEFLRLIGACEHGQIDLVITKSISRFARNTLDCLNYIRRLKELGIPIIFEKESINTMDATGEVLITILASLAQQESASISQNVTMGIRYVMQEGRGRVNYERFLGYTRGMEKGTLVIVPREAEVVRRIYRSYLEGFSPAAIARQLEADGVRAPAGGRRWHASTIASILRNEKYCGDLLLQKYYTQDYLTHKVAKNDGQLPQYFVEAHHEPIVPKEVFVRVQGERMRRSSLRDRPSELRLCGSATLVGKLVCGTCGQTLKRCGTGEGLTTAWWCRPRAMRGYPVVHGPTDQACGLGGIAEPALEAGILQAFNRLPSRKAWLLQERRRILERVLVGIDERIARESVRCDRLAAALDTAGRSRCEFGDGKASKEPSASRDSRTLRLLLATLRRVHQSLIVQRAALAHREMQICMLLELIAQMKGHAELGERGSSKEVIACPACSDPGDFFRRTRHALSSSMLSANGSIAVFDEPLVARHLEKVIVFNGRWEVRFKAGLAEEIRAPSVI